jgi:mRNA interferase MazF
MKRGDVIIALVPHASGSAPKSRPALVVQSDFYNTRIANVLVATITSNLSRNGDAAHLLIDVSTPDGRQSGLKCDSLVSCLNLATLPPADIGRVIGSFTNLMMQDVDKCLKAAMGIP